MNHRRAFLAVACLVVPTMALAQVDATITRKKAIIGVVNPVLSGGRIFIDDGSNPSFQDVVVLKVETDYQFHRLKTRRDGVKFEAEKISDNEYLFVGPGNYIVEIWAFDPTKGLDDTELQFQIGKPVEPPKPPEPQPVIVVPNDYNIGQLAYDKAPRDPDMAKQIATHYREGAALLFGPRLRTVNDVVAEIDAKFNAKQCKDQATCEKWAEWKTAVVAALKSEQVKRGTFTGQDWFQALTEIAVALEAVR